VQRGRTVATKKIKIKYTRGGASRNTDGGTRTDTWKDSGVVDGCGRSGRDDQGADKGKYRCAEGKKIENNSRVLGHVAMTKNVSIPHR